MTTIMVIEDDSTMRSLLKTLFELEGYSVDVCHESTEPEIIKAIVDSYPDIVYMDVYLRSANGIRIVSSVKAQTQRQVRFLMSSGMPLWPECKEAGADAFLPKPFMPDELILKIKSLI